MTQLPNEWREFREELLTFFTGADHDIERVAEIQYEDMFKHHQTSISAHLVARIEGLKVQKKYLPSKNNLLRQKQDVWNNALDQVIDIVKDNN